MVNVFTAMLAAMRGADLDDAFAYETPKIVRIRDRKLGCLYHLFWIGIIIYVIFALFYSLNFVDTEIPQGSISSWTEESAAYESRTLTAPYCNNTDYDYRYDQCWASENTPCVDLAMRDIFHHQTSSAKGLTTVRFRSPLTGNTFCTSGFEYVAGVEDLYLIVSHSFYSEIADLKRQNPSCAIKNNNDETMLTTTDGMPVKIKIKDMLSYAGASLDSKIKIGSTTDPEAQAFLRLTGAVVKVEFAYENYYEPFQLSPTDIQCSLRFRVSSGEWGTLQQTRTATAFVTEMGLAIQVSSVGTIGTFSIMALLATIVSATVFFKIARATVDFLALKVLKQRYLNRTAKYEWTVDYSDEKGQGDLVDFLAEDYISVSRRDLRAAIDNVLRALHRVGVKVDLPYSLNSNPPGEVRKPPCIFCGQLRHDGFCKKSAPSKPPSRPRTHLIKWRNAVDGNDSESWAVFDAHTKRGIIGVVTNLTDLDDDQTRGRPAETPGPSMDVSNPMRNESPPTGEQKELSV